MKVTFVCPGDELFGIEYMSSILKENGIYTDLVFDPRLLQDSVLQKSFLIKLLNIDRNSIVESVLATKPSLVAITSNTNNISWGLEIADKLKKDLNSIPIIFGGPHVTAVPERVLSKGFVDFVCVGPGEYALVKLCKSIESGNKEFDIPGIWYKKGNELVPSDSIYAIDDLDRLPFPDKDLFYSKFPFLSDPYTIITSRGCPFSCSYCMENMYHNLYKTCGARLYHRRSVKNVIDELVMAKEKWAIKSVQFYDELFAFNKKWLRDFSEAYKEKIDLPFRCSVHPGVLDDEIMELLRYAGVYTIIMGVESLNDHILKNVLNRKCSYNQIKSSMELLKKSKIYFSVDHMLGLPEESEEDHKKAASLYSELRPNNILLYWLVYYPKTAIVKYALERQIIKKRDIELIEEGKGEISYKRNTQESYKIAYPYFLLLNLIPVKIIPKFIFEFIVKKDLVKFCKIPFVIILIKQIFDSLDQRSSRNEQLRKTVSFIRYGLAFNKKRIN